MINSFTVIFGFSAFIITFFLIHKSLHIVIKSSSKDNIDKACQLILYTILVIFGAIALYQEYESIGKIGATRFFRLALLYGVSMYAFEIIFLQISRFNQIHHIYYIILGMIFIYQDYYLAIFPAIYFVELTVIFDLISFLTRKSKTIGFKFYAFSLMVHGFVWSIPLFLFYLILQDGFPNDTFLDSILLIALSITFLASIGLANKAPTLITKFVKYQRDKSP
ncbi:hypothetical protein ACG1BZ_15360 [Microbulbifer sp. CNSA002]|uniref:hypothetical protein n=1 Tax=Microbulbifer sp. CNSA002 TaxID=3373604 RepID=UPI0039B3CBD7